MAERCYTSGPSAGRQNFAENAFTSGDKIIAALPGSDIDDAG